MSQPLENTNKRQISMEDFRKLVYFWVAAIPQGQVSSYGAIAKLAGFPRHARHVSKSLGMADKSLKLPWQRVIGSDGKIAFHSDSDHYATQLHLLQKEGVIFVNGKVDMKQLAWKPVQSPPTNAGELSPEDFFK